MITLAAESVSVAVETMGKSGSRNSIDFAGRVSAALSRIAIGIFITTTVPPTFPHNKWLIRLLRFS